MFTFSLYLVLYTDAKIVHDKSEGDDDNLGVIIGGAIGGVLFLVLVIIIIVCLVKRNKGRF